MAVQLVALRAFIYKDRSYRAGEQFEAEPVTAAVLKRRQDARFATASDQPKKPRTYRRRDLVAETPTTPESDV